MATQGTGLNISIGNHTITFTITNFLLFTENNNNTATPLLTNTLSVRRLVFKKFTNISALNFDMKFLAINQNLVKKYSQYFSF